MEFLALLFPPFLPPSLPHSLRPFMESLPCPHRAHSLLGKTRDRLSRAVTEGGGGLGHWGPEEGPHPVRGGTHRRNLCCAQQGCPRHLSSSPSYTYRIQEDLVTAPACTAGKWQGQAASSGPHVSKVVPVAPLLSCWCVGVSQGRARQSRGNSLCQGLKSILCARLKGSWVWAVRAEARSTSLLPLSTGAVGLEPCPTG